MKWIAFFGIILFFFSVIIFPVGIFIYLRKEKYNKYLSELENLVKIIYGDEYVPSVGWYSADSESGGVVAVVSVYNKFKNCIDDLGYGATEQGAIEMSVEILRNKVNNNDYWKKTDELESLAELYYKEPVAVVIQDEIIENKDFAYKVIIYRLSVLNGLGKTLEQMNFVGSEEWALNTALENFQYRLNKK